MMYVLPGEMKLVVAVSSVQCIDMMHWGTITLLLVHRPVTSICVERIEAFGSSGHRMKTCHLWSI